MSDHEPYMLSVGGAGVLVISTESFFCIQSAVNSLDPPCKFVSPLSRLVIAWTEAHRNKAVHHGEHSQEGSHGNLVCCGTRPQNHWYLVAFWYRKPLEFLRTGALQDLKCCLEFISSDAPFWQEKAKMFRSWEQNTSSIYILFCRGLDA